MPCENLVGNIENLLTALRAEAGAQQDLERIRNVSRAYKTNTRHSFTGVIIIRFIDMD